MWDPAGRGVEIDGPVGPSGAPTPLRLAFVSHCLRTHDQSAGRIGGAERAAAELLAALRRRDDVVVTPIVASAETDRLRFATFAIGALGKLTRLAERGEIQAILFTAMPTAWMSWVLSPVLRRHGVVTAAICHGHDVTMPFGPYQKLVQKTFGALDAVLPVSRATGDHCLARGLDPRRLHVTPNGADAARFDAPPSPDARRALLRAAFPSETADLPDDALVVCTVGRQVRRKGHAWFAGAVMPKLPDDVHLWLVGEGPEAVAIETAAIRAGTAGRVRRLGAISEHRLAALYRGADLFVMPNIPVQDDIEGFGLVLLEANLNGLPVVAAELEGVGEVIREGVNGRLARSEDADAFVRAILALRADPVERRRLALSAEAHARDRYGWRGVAESQMGVLTAARRQMLAAAA